MKGEQSFPRMKELVNVITKLNTQAVMKAGSNLEEQRQNRDLKCGVLRF